MLMGGIFFFFFNHYLKFVPKIVGSREILGETPVFAIF